MRCEDFRNQLNARADGELAPQDSASLDAHLAECAQCRAEAEQSQAIDAELRAAFAPRRVAAGRLADNTAALVRAAAGAAGSSVPQVTPASGWAWRPALVGLAAGFLLAAAVFRPWQPSTAEPFSSPPDPVAHLAVASGPVEVRAARQLGFLTCPPAGSIGQDSIVRTGPTARCELSLKDGNALRLDCNTEVTLHASNVEINRGRLWSSGPPGRSGVEIQSGGGTIVAQAASQLAVDCQPQAVRLIVVHGAANVQAGKESLEVGPGKRVRIRQGKVEDDPEWRDALLETAWVNSLLALRSSEHPELVDRVNGLLAKVGAAKLSYLYEDELRRLGDDGVPPLLAYLGSTRDTPNVAQRATAARIVADVAEARWIADLIALLTDENPEVRFHAARSLERLTGRNQGCEARTWQSAPWAACEGPHAMWLKWWEENRDRYPAARREIPAPKSPPF